MTMFMWLNNSKLRFLQFHCLLWNFTKDLREVVLNLPFRVPVSESDQCCGMERVWLVRVVWDSRIRGLCDCTWEIDLEPTGLIRVYKATIPSTTTNCVGSLVSCEQLCLMEQKMGFGFRVITCQILCRSLIKRSHLTWPWLLNTQKSTVVVN